MGGDGDNFGNVDVTFSLYFLMYQMNYPPFMEHKAYNVYMIN